MRGLADLWALRGSQGTSVSRFRGRPGLVNTVRSGGAPGGAQAVPQLCPPSLLATPADRGSLHGQRQVPCARCPEDLGPWLTLAAPQQLRSPTSRPRQTENGLLPAIWRKGSAEGSHQKRPAAPRAGPRPQTQRVRPGRGMGPRHQHLGPSRPGQQPDAGTGWLGLSCLTQEGTAATVLSGVAAHGERSHVTRAWENASQAGFRDDSCPLSLCSAQATP